MVPDQRFTFFSFLFVPARAAPLRRAARRRPFTAALAGVVACTDAVAGVPVALASKAFFSFFLSFSLAPASCSKVFGDAVSPGESGFLLRVLRPDAGFAAGCCPGAGVRGEPPSAADDVPPAGEPPALTAGGCTPFVPDLFRLAIVVGWRRSAL